MLESEVDDFLTYREAWMVRVRSKLNRAGLLYANTEPSGTIADAAFEEMCSSAGQRHDNVIHDLADSCIRHTFVCISWLLND